MIPKLVYALAVLAVLSSIAREAGAASCAVDLSVTVTDGRPSVSCAADCPTGENGFSVTGTAFKRFTTLDALNKMVKINYADGRLADCQIVPLLTDEQLAARADQIRAIYDACKAELQPTTPEPTTTTTAEPVVIRTRCRDGFTLLGDTCYMVSPNANTKHEGDKFCAQYGATLATINSQEEQNRVAAAMTTRVWLALNDEEQEGHFRVAGQDTSYTNWNNGEPNNWQDSEDCTMMIPDYGSRWYDDNCQAHYRALCEHEPIPVYEEPTCPEGQQRFLDSCYFLSNVGNFDAGANECRSRGGYPVFINSQQEQDFIGSYLTETTYFGYSDRSEESIFKADNFGVALYTNWNADTNEPNNLYDEEHCTEGIASWGFKWNDVNCNIERRTLCEAPATVAA